VPRASTRSWPRRTAARSAARDYLAAQRVDEAARVLGQTQGPFSAEQVTEQTLLNAEVALARGQPQEALRLLNAIAVPTAADQAVRYRTLRASATALAAGRQEGGRPGPGLPAAPHLALLLPSPVARRRPPSVCAMAS